MEGPKSPSTASSATTEIDYAADSLSEYEILEQLGKGGEGSVHLCKRKYRSHMKSENEEYFVLKKKICMSLRDANQALSEALTMARVQSDYIVHFVDTFLTQIDQEGEQIYVLCIVLEYCSGGDLASYISKINTPILRAPRRTASESGFSKTKLKTWAFQLCKAIAAVHDLKLIHRDLKSENVFLTKRDDLKVGDFGLAFSLRNQLKAKERAGTSYYMAPEILDRREYNQKADIWGLGCIFLELATLKLMIQRGFLLGEEILKPEFKLGNILAEIPVELGDFRDIIASMLEPEYLKRPSIEVILRSPFFESFLKSSPSMQRKSNSFFLENSHFGGVIRRELNKTHVPMAAALFARCYKDEPRFTVHFKNPETREKCLAEMFKLTTYYCLSHGHAVWGLFSSSGEIIGAVLWLPPDEKKASVPAKFILKFFWNTKSDFFGVQSFLSSMRRSQKNWKHMLDSPKWVLLYCAIDPSVRRRKLGEFLCQPVLEMADFQQQECYSWLMEENAVTFMQKLDFQMTGPYQSREEKELVYFLCIRKPKPIDKKPEILEEKGL